MGIEESPLAAAYVSNGEEFYKSLLKNFGKPDDARYPPYAYEYSLTQGGIVFQMQGRDAAPSPLMLPILWSRLIVMSLPRKQAPEPRRRSHLRGCFMWRAHLWERVRGQVKGLQVPSHPPAKLSLALFLAEHYFA